MNIGRISQYYLSSISCRTVSLWVGIYWITWLYTHRCLLQLHLYRLKISLLLNEIQPNDMGYCWLSEPCTASWKVSMFSMFKRAPKSQFLSWNWMIHITVSAWMSTTIHNCQLKTISLIEWDTVYWYRVLYLHNTYMLVQSAAADLIKCITFKSKFFHLELYVDLLLFFCAYLDICKTPLS